MAFKIKSNCLSVLTIGLSYIDILRGSQFYLILIQVVFSIGLWWLVWYPAWNPILFNFNTGSLLDRPLLTSLLSKNTSEKANKSTNFAFYDFHMLNYHLSNDTRFRTSTKQNKIILATLFCVNVCINIHRVYSDDRIQIS